MTAPKEGKPYALWGGRFDAKLDAAFERMNRSLPVDARLLPEELRASAAWARALERAGVLDARETAAIVGGLEAIGARAQADPGWVFASGEEDVHTFVEARLHETAGEAARRLHSGRSRNEQIATDLRLWAKSAAARCRGGIAALGSALVGLAERSGSTPIAGFTHLRAGQPILLAHRWLGWVATCERDAGRFADAAARADECPLGSGALAGCPFPVDRAAIAAELGFARPTANSTDAVSDRDFCVELAAAAALGAVHLSHLAEEMSFLALPEIGAVELDESVCTGSSLMPQKKNPDALELVRGAAGRPVGSLVALLTILKGLPSTYDRDLQHGNREALDALDAFEQAVAVMARVVATARVVPERCTALASSGFATATDLADHLVGRGVPFRDAHEIVGRVVRRAIESKRPLEAWSLAQLREIDGRFGDDALASLDVQRSIARRAVAGGTAPESVRRQLEAARRRFPEDREAAR